MIVSVLVLDGMLISGRLADASVVFRSATSLEQYVMPLIHRLIPILLNQKSPRSLMENSAVAIGRIALVCPTPIAPHLNHFARQWYVDDSEATVLHRR
jgi:hypothetical protein